jgi:hypothetical protein
MLQAAKKSRHVILGTATPIQTNIIELWDSLSILNSGADFVLGDALSPWQDMEAVLPYITGKEQPQTTKDVWSLLSNPLPPPNEHEVISRIRDQLNIAPDVFESSLLYEDLDYLVQEIWLSECLADDFFKQYNPVLRHVVLRKRKQLEDDGLLDRIGVVHSPRAGTNAQIPVPLC